MAFSSNPLALSVPDHVFESWIRDKGYLELIDHRTSDLHALTSVPGATTPADPSTTPADPSTTDTSSVLPYGLFISLFSHLKTLASLFTLNPFSKLTSGDFSGDTPSWTRDFIGSIGSYSFPSSPDQARLRVHENVKRFSRNYASLLALFLACSLYQMPLALAGLLVSFALWDVFRYYANKYGLDRYPTLRQILVRVAQCATAVILFFSNVQAAVFCALGVSYTAYWSGLSVGAVAAFTFPVERVNQQSTYPQRSETGPESMLGWMNKAGDFW